MKQSMRVSDVMNIKVAVISVDATMRLAAELLTLTQAADLIVVDAERNFLGVVSEGDLIRALLPDFNEVVKAGGSLDAATQMFLDNGRNLEHESIKRLIIFNPITVTPDEDLLKVSTVMMEKMIRRLPVVERGRFVGSISRADICWALLCAPRTG
jgi:CBS domain-containing protein